MTTSTSNTSTLDESPQDLPSEVKPVIALLAIVVFIAVINGTMINVALPHIGKEFEVGEGTYGWLVTGYSLTFGIFNAINGRLSDKFGKKTIYLIGLAVLGLGSLAVALTPTLSFAISVRLIQGAGAAALPVLGTSIIKQIVPEKQQGQAVGIILSTVGVAASIGPLLGSLIVQYLSWRYVFAATGISLLTVPLAYKLLPDSLNEGDDRPFDWQGATLLALGISSMLYSFELIQSQAPLWQLGALLVTSTLLLAAFGWRITRADSPFVAPSTFTRPAYLASCAVAAVSNAGRFGSVVVAPIVLTEVNQVKPLVVGAALLPGAVAIALLSSRAGRWADRHGPRQPVALGLVSMTLGSIIMAYFAGGSVWGLGAGLTLFGVGYALAQSPLVSTVNRILPKAQAGAGVGVFMMIFFVGGAAGVATCVTISDMYGMPGEALFGLIAPKGARFAIALLVLGALTLLAQIPARMLPNTAS